MKERYRIKPNTPISYGRYAYPSCGFFYPKKETKEKNEEKHYDVDG